MTAIVLGIVALVLWWRAEPLIRQALSIAQEKAAAVVESAKKPEPLKPEERMPAQLYAFAMGESEPWAREESLKRIVELYQECGDWRDVTNRLLNAEAKEINAIPGMIS